MNEFRAKDRRLKYALKQGKYKQLRAKKQWNIKNVNIQRNENGNREKKKR